MNGPLRVNEIWEGDAKIGGGSFSNQSASFALVWWRDRLLAMVTAIDERRTESPHCAQRGCTWSALVLVRPCRHTVLHFSHHTRFTARFVLMSNFAGLIFEGFRFGGHLNLYGLRLGRCCENWPGCYCCVFCLFLVGFFFVILSSSIVACRCSAESASIVHSNGWQVKLFYWRSSSEAIFSLTGRVFAKGRIYRRMWIGRERTRIGRREGRKQRRKPYPDSGADELAAAQPEAEKAWVCVGKINQREKTIAHSNCCTSSSCRIWCEQYCALATALRSLYVAREWLSAWQMIISEFLWIKFLVARRSGARMLVEELPNYHNNTVNDWSWTSGFTVVKFY